MPAYRTPNKNTWYVKFRYKDWNGQSKWITKRGFNTKREALQWEQEFLQQKNGSLDMTFRAFIKVYIEERTPRLKESTCVTKENIIDTKLLPYFGEKRLRDITTADVLKWQNVMLNYVDPETKKPYSKSYLKTVHNQLSAILNHAVRYYGLRDNPARVVGNMGSEKNIEMKFWTREEYQLFSEAMMDDPLAFYCFEVLYWCGIREGELLALTPNDIDFEKKTISINKTFQHIRGKDIVTEPKTPKSKRTVIMPDALCDELKDYLKMCYSLHPTDRLFPTSKNYLQRKMCKGCAQQGLRRIRVHDIRHSHVSLLVDMGFSAVAIAERMGHESIDITYRYAHLFPSVQSQMANQLNKMMEVDNNVTEKA